MINPSSLLNYRPTPEEVYGVDGLVYNPDKGFFVQKRAEDRTFLPGCWDVSGGHVDPGETIGEALKRELMEETGWVLEDVLAWVHSYEWTGRENKRCIAHTFIVKVSGDLENPKIETHKNSTWRWISENDMELLYEGREIGAPCATYDSVLKAYRWMKVNAA